MPVCLYVCVMYASQTGVVTSDLDHQHKPHQQQVQGVSVQGRDNLNYPDPCVNDNYLLKKHKCSECDYRSIYKWVVSRHWQRRHSNKIKMNDDHGQIIRAGTGIHSQRGPNNRVKYVTQDTLSQQPEVYDLRFIEDFKIYLTGPAR